MSKILAVFAHPDDETDACGGTLALYAGRGVEIILVAATNGSAGKSGPYQVQSQQELGEIREKELKKAGKILGIKELHFLGFTDGDLEKTDENLIAAKIKPFLKNLQPEVLITWDPTGFTFHPDHVVINQLVTKLALESQKETGFPKKIYWKVTPRSVLEKHELIGMNDKKVSGVLNEEVTTRIDITEAKDKKIAALEAHVSQKDVLTSSYEQARDSNEEFFILVSPKPSGENREQDLFYGI